MMLLSGYTLGFFFPKQKARLPASPPVEATVLMRPETVADAKNAEPAGANERAEVPAFSYFYRYF